MSSNWMDDLQSQYKSIVETKAQAQSKPNYLLVVILLLGAGGLWYVYQNKTAPSFNYQQPYTQQPTLPGSRPQLPGLNYSNPQSNYPTTPQSYASDVDMLKRQYENIHNATSKIWERTKWTSDRITLLGTVNNHNVMVLQQNLPRNELIFLNEDWTISRLPNRIALSPQDQQFLQKFVR